MNTMFLFSSNDSLWPLMERGFDHFILLCYGQSQNRKNRRSNILSKSNDITKLLVNASQNTSVSRPIAMILQYRVCDVILLRQFLELSLYRIPGQVCKNIFFFHNSCIHEPMLLNGTKDHCRVLLK